MGSVFMPEGDFETAQSSGRNNPIHDLYKQGLYSYFSDPEERILEPVSHGWQLIDLKLRLSPIDLRFIKVLALEPDDSKLGERAFCLKLQYLGEDKLREHHKELKKKDFHKVYPAFYLSNGHYKWNYPDGGMTVLPREEWNYPERKETERKEKGKKFP